jgi:ABC-type phosphate/phosphonate transport system substrate-binding protein
MIYERSCDAGASYVDARDPLAWQFPDIYEVVPVIAVSPPIPNSHNFSVAEDISPELKLAIMTALLEISEDQEGVLLLQQLGFENIVQADHSIFAGLEALIFNAGLTPQEVWDTYIFRETMPN